jgi:hypothetical protein
MERASVQGPESSQDGITVPGSGSFVVDHFSLVEGGPIYRFQVAIGMALPDRSGVIRRALLTTLITWFPLLVLSFLQSRAVGTQVQIPFLYDFAAAARFLIGLPLLVIAEAVIDPRLRRAVMHFAMSGLVSAGDLPAFEDTILKVNKRRDSVLAAVVIIACAFAPSIWYKETELLKSGISTWHTIISPSGEGLSFAGWWFGVVSLPLYRLLLFRWIWMIILWALFLRRVTRIELGCIATHPDRSGGLGFLAEAELLFGFIAFATSAVVAGAFGNAIAYEAATVSSLKFLMIAFCVLTVAILSAPLLVLTPNLARVKRKGMHEYAGLGTAYTQAFDAKWIQGRTPEREPLLGTGDIQSLADLSNSFSVVREMRVVLIDKKVLVGLALPAILPLIPLLIAATPADQLMRAVLKLLV